MNLGRWVAPEVALVSRVYKTARLKNGKVHFDLKQSLVQIRPMSALRQKRTFKRT